MRGHLQRGDIPALLQKWSGIRSKSPAPAMAGSVQPVLIVGDAREESVPHAARPVIAGVDLLPGAGNNAWISLLNPAGSSVELHVSLITAFSPGANQTITYVAPNSGAPPGGAQAGSIAFQDGNLSGAPQGQIFAGGVIAPSGGALFLGRAGVASTFVLPVEIIIPPGDSISVVGQTAAGELFVGFFFDEVPLR